MQIHSVKCGFLFRLFKKNSTAVLLVLTTFFFGQIVVAQQRYQHVLFAKIDSITNITYGSAISIKGQSETLLLDVFKPPREDKVRYRPMVIYIHGGGFVNGTKSSDLSAMICKGFAKRGYVAATIDYRLGVESPRNNAAYYEALYRAQQDAKAAVRFFRKNAEEYGIDATQIFVVGGSAGAMTALAVAYMDKEEIPTEIDQSKWGDIDGNSGNAGVSSSVQGVINCWGALPNLQWIQKGSVPLLNIGGSLDKTVPYDSSYDYHGFKYGPAILYQYCKQVGVATSLQTFIGAGHSLNSDIVKYDSCVNVMIDWLYHQLAINNNKPQLPLFKNINSVKIFKPNVVLATMEKVANWQMSEWDVKGYKYHKWHWANAAGYTGFTELAAISKDNLYNSRLLNICNDVNWNTGPSRFFADDYCIAQTFISLYTQKHDELMIAKFRLQADSILAQPHTESLDWKDSINYREWAWCDALFMGPASFAYLATATKEDKYLDLAIKLWQKTHAYLYDTTEHLYYRDQRYFTQKEKNGTKVFWSRGNGWVLAGLVRLLDNIPNDDECKAQFIKIYQEMAIKIAAIQQADGSWHTSLLDPNTYSKPEISGTGFYTYALLWGINKGLLDKKTFWPVVAKSWKMMASVIRENGKIGFIQPIGSAPEAIDENSSEIYGIGAFLLAGSQMYSYVTKQ